jgi:hypothetical protein
VTDANLPPERVDRDPDAPNRRNLLIGAAVVLALVAGILVAILVTRDDDDTVTSGSSSTTTSITTTTVASTTTGSTSTTATTTTTTPGTVSDAERATIVWPEPGSSTTYDDGTAAARGFAVDLVGFQDPLLGEFQQGDSRSGEVEVKALTTGPVTTVMVRQMSDDHWYVIGAATDDIQVDTPVAGTAIDNPLQTTGQARAFEGNVQVRVFERGNATPLGQGNVTGSGGPELGPFTGSITWTNPGGGWGIVVYSTTSAADGRVWQAAAIPVGFIGGD